MSKNNILKRLSPLHIVALVCAAVILVTIIVSAVLFGMNAADKKKDEFNYNDNNLIKQYITLEDYKNLEVTHKYSELRDVDVEEAVLNLIAGEKNKYSVEDVSYDPTATITVGDVVNLYYRGYVVDAEGNRDYKDGMSNLVGKAYSAMSAHELSIGNSGFIAGFALELEGTKVGNYPEINRQRGDLDIGTEDIIFVTYQRNPLSYNKYSGVETPGTVESATSVLIDLSLGKDKIDEIYGLGFYDMLFTGRADNAETEDIDESINVAKADGKNTINNTTEGFKTEKNENADVVAYKYTTIKVEYKMSGDYYEGCEPIEVVFPEDYSAADLAGKTAYFQIMIESVEEYSYTINEVDVSDVVCLRNIENADTRAAVNTVLKSALEDNKDFQKYLEAQTDKEDYYTNYKNYLVAKNVEDNALSDKLALYDAIVDALVEKATVLKDHPELEEKYKASLITFRSSYASNGTDYATIEEYAEAVIGGKHYVYVYEENGEWKIFNGTAEEAEAAGYAKKFDWKAAVRQLSVDYYTERLAIHQIVNELGLLNSEGAYDNAYNAIFDDYIAEYTKSYCESNDKDADKLTDKEKAQIEAEVKSYIISELGHAELEERAYYQLVYNYYTEKDADGNYVRLTIVAPTDAE